MSERDYFKTNPELDLVLDREVDVPPALVWRVLTMPEHVVRWLTPAPWQTVSCEIDLQPGGRFHFVMRSPEGQEFPNTCCYLEIVENEKLVWTSALAPGYRPVGGDVGLPFTAMITLEPSGNGARYVARAIHADPAVTKRHADMGFHDGWGKSLDQLVAVAKSL
jgi:uncharacterized protein YndB with AHSA1/START domain